MQNSIKPGLKEAGIDEDGRGCLMGRVYTGAVILPKDFPDPPSLRIQVFFPVDR